MTVTKSLHFSCLKRMAQSPAHCLCAMNEADKETSTSMLMGSAVASVALGGPRVLVYEGKRDKRVAVYRAFLDDNPDAYILNPREHFLVTGMAKALKQDRFAIDALQGRHEIPLEWMWLGRRCATRGIDVDTDTCLTELKTTKFAEPGWFAGECRRRAYVEQLCWYANAIKGPRELRIVAVESAPPFAVTVFRITPELREQAEKRLRLWMERFLVCEDSGEWPAYVQTEVWLEPRDVDLDLSDLEEEDAA